MMKWEDRVFPEPNSGCHIWMGTLTDRGYGHLTHVRAHRIAWKMFRGEIPDGMCVLHRCDNRACVNPDHLFLGTQLQNIDDMEAKGRQSRRGRSKLSGEDVLAILNDDRFHGVIAKQYGVDGSQISRIKNGRTHRAIRADPYQKIT